MKRLAAMLRNLMIGKPVCLLLLAALAASAWAQNAPTKAEIEKITDAIAEAEAALKKTSSQRSELEARLQQAEQAMSELSGEIEATEQQIQQEQARLEDLRQRSAELEADKAAQQTLIAQYLRSAYRTGQQEYLKLLLNQEEVDRSARALQYYRYFNEARAEKIASFNRTLRELRSLRSEIAASTERLQQRRAQLGAQREELQTNQQQRLALLDELEQSLDARGSELARLKQQREEMEVLLEELRAIAEMSLNNEGQPFGEMRGKLPWPTQGPLLNSYGEHSLGDLNWQGVTIAAKSGAEVHAIHHGRVVYADWFTQTGLLLIIDHGDGYMSLYAHNERLYREVGDWVNSGELIAAVGNTGGQRETGVYFEIRHNGRSQDPINWCLPRN